MLKEYIVSFSILTKWILGCIGGRTCVENDCCSERPKIVEKSIIRFLKIPGISVEHVNFILKKKIGMKKLFTLGVSYFLTRNAFECKYLSLLDCLNKYCKVCLI